MPRYDVLIQEGTICTAEGTFIGDIGIKYGKIVSLVKDAEGDASRVINAKGKQVLPGGIDVHVHFHNPYGKGYSVEGFFEGTRAAASGGITTVIDFGVQDPKKGLIAGIQKRMKEADPEVCIDYSLHAMITAYNKPVSQEMAKAAELGIPTFKMYTTYKSYGWYSDDGMLYDAMLHAKKLGGMILIHAESDGLLNYFINQYLPEKKSWGAYAHALSRPNLVEAEAVSRMVYLTAASGSSTYIVHLSTGEGADLIQQAKLEGIDIDAETCPQYLLLDESLFRDKERGHLYATCPQLKKPADNQRLWEAIIQGDLNIIATDTCTFTRKQKDKWNGDFTKIPYGMPGVETLLPLVYTYGYKEGRISLPRLVELLSTQPAKKMGFYPQKGTLQIGSDADIIIIDPDKKKTIKPQNLQTATDWSPYEGWELLGFPEYTLSKGKLVIDRGEFVGKKGQGRFIPRKLI
jgi:dihydropyrimidinase